MKIKIVHHEIIHVDLFLTYFFNLSARRPNIILIMADDMGYECLGGKGGEIYKTPCCSIINPILTTTTCILWNMGCITLLGERLTFSTLLSDWLNKNEFSEEVSSMVTIEDPILSSKGIKK
ncbi:MAG: hypothetical protein QNL65_10290 [Opitutales bacterium]